MTGASGRSTHPDIVRRAVGDGLWNAAALAIPGLANLVIVAVLLRTLGPIGFAPWAAAVAMVSVLTVLDGGLSATTVRNVARARAGDRDALRLVRAAIGAYAGLGLAVLVLGAAASLSLPLVVGAQRDEASSIVAIGLILTVDLAVVIGTGGWLGSLRGTRRFDLVFAATSAQVTIALPLTLVLVPTDGLVGAALAQLAGRIAGRVVAAIAMRSTASWIGLWPRLVPAASWRRVGVFTLPILAIGASTQLGVGVDPLIVAVVGTPAAVGQYAAGAGLARYLAFLLFPILGVLLPSFSEISYVAERAAADTLVRCVRLAALFGALGFGTLAANAAPALESWIGRSDPLSEQVLVLYAVAHASWTPSQVMILMLIARGRHGLVGAALLGDAIVNVALSVALATMVGPIGVAVSTALMLVLAHGLVIPALAAGHLGIPARKLAAAMFGGFAIGAAVVAGAALIPLDGPTGLALRVAIAALAGIAALAVDQRVVGARLHRPGAREALAATDAAPHPPIG